MTHGEVADRHCMRSICIIGGWQCGPSKCGGAGGRHRDDHCPHQVLDCIVWRVVSIVVEVPAADLTMRARKAELEEEDWYTSTGLPHISERTWLVTLTLAISHTINAHHAGAQTGFLPSPESGRLAPDAAASKIYVRRHDPLPSKLEEFCSNPGGRMLLVCQCHWLTCENI